MAIPLTADLAQSRQQQKHGVLVAASPLSVQEG